MPNRWRNAQKQVQVYTPAQTRIPPALLKQDFETFQHTCGLPLHPHDLQPCLLTSAQLDFYYSYVDPAQRSWLHLNKARQCGWSECVLRILAYHGFHKYAGKKVGVVAGTNMNTTKQIFSRLEELFANTLSSTVNEKESGSMHLVLKNGTEYWGGPATPETFTGWTKFGAFMLDEAAKWNLVDDRPVLNAMLPIARSNRSDVYMISTPKGPRGFFYHISQAEANETQFARTKYDIYEGGYELYSYDEIEEMIASSEEDPMQEYLCQFTIGRDSIFGYNTNDDYSTAYAETDYSIPSKAGKYKYREKQWQAA